MAFKFNVNTGKIEEVDEEEAAKMAVESEDFSQDDPNTEYSYNFETGKIQRGKYTADTEGQKKKQQEARISEEKRKSQEEFDKYAPERAQYAEDSVNAAKEGYKNVNEYKDDKARKESPYIFDKIVSGIFGLFRNTEDVKGEDTKKTNELIQNAAPVEADLNYLKSTKQSLESLDEEKKRAAEERGYFEEADFANKEDYKTYTQLKDQFPDSEKPFDPFDKAITQLGQELYETVQDPDKARKFETEEGLKSSYERDSMWAEISSKQLEDEVFTWENIKGTLDSMTEDQRKRYTADGKALTKAFFDENFGVAPAYWTAYQDLLNTYQDFSAFGAIEKRIAELKDNKYSYDMYLGKMDQKRDLLTSIARGLDTDIEKQGRFPILGQIVEATDKQKREVILNDTSVMKRYHAGEKLSTEELKTIQKYEADIIRSRLQLGYADNIGSMISFMPTFMVEFALTGGLYNAGKTVGTKILGGVATKGITGKAIAGLGAELIGSAVRLNTAFMPHVVNKTMDYTLPSADIMAGENGDKLIKILDEGEDFWAAFPKGYLSQYVELIAENAGVIVEEGLPFVKKWIVGKYLDDTVAKGVQIEAAGGVAKFLKQVGYNGILGEVFEEELGEPFQALIEGREYNAPLLTAEGTSRLVQSAAGIAPFALVGGSLSTQQKRKIAETIMTDSLDMQMFKGVSSLSDEVFKKQEEIKAHEKEMGVSTAIEIPVEMESGMAQEIEATGDLTNVTEEGGAMEGEQVAEASRVVTYEELPKLLQSSVEKIANSETLTKEKFVNAVEATLRNSAGTPQGMKVKNAQLALQSLGISFGDLFDVAQNAKEQIRAKSDAKQAKVVDKKTEKLSGSLAQLQEIYKKSGDVKAFKAEVRKLVAEGKLKMPSEMKFRTKGGKLVALHNLAEDTLRTVLKAGGLSTPSVAIKKADSEYNDFGEITLVGDEKMVKPSKTTRTFSGDIFSPTVGHLVDEDGKVGLKSTANVSEDLIDLLKNKDIAKLVKDSTDSVELNVGMKNNEKIFRFLEEKAEEMGTNAYDLADRFDRQIWKRVPANAENLAEAAKLFSGEKGMDKLRGQEAGLFGVPARAYGYAEFQSVDQIRELSELLTEKEEVEAAGEVASVQYAQGIDEILKTIESRDITFENGIALENALIFNDTISEMVQGLQRPPSSIGIGLEQLSDFNDNFEKVLRANKKVVREALKYSRQNLSDGDIKKFVEYVAYDDLYDLIDRNYRNQKVEYFESKILRAVKLGEFVGAIVPNETPADLINQLKLQGLRVVKYDMMKNGDRLRALSEAFDDVRFRKLADVEDARKTQISEDEMFDILQMNQKLFGDRNIGIIESIITPTGQEALGSYMDSWINIVSGQSSATDTFLHESVHKAIDIMLTETERKALFDSAATQYGLYGLEAEERIAEDFINFVNTGQAAVENKTIFQKLLDFLRSLIAGKDTIQQFYTDLISGKLNKANQMNTGEAKFRETATDEELDSLFDLFVNYNKNEQKRDITEEYLQKVKQNQEKKIANERANTWETAAISTESLQGKLGQKEIEFLKAAYETASYGVGDVAGKIYSELQNVQAGYRYAIEKDGQGGTMEWKGADSTFPDWFPLRSKVEIDDFLARIPKDPIQWTAANNPFRAGTAKFEAYETFIFQLGGDLQGIEPILKELEQDLVNETGKTVDQLYTEIDAILNPPQPAKPEAKVIASNKDAYQVPVGQGMNKIVPSTAYTRIAERLDEELRSDPKYEKVNLAEDAARAITFVENNFSKAKRIALGLDAPPNGILEASISIAASEKAFAEGNFVLADALENARSLRQTRRGQEIVAERGRVNENSPQYFVQQVLKRRLLSKFSTGNSHIFENFSFKDAKDLELVKETKSRKAFADYVDKETKEVAKKLSKDEIKIKNAQDIIDLLTCK